MKSSVAKCDISIFVVFRYLQLNVIKCKESNKKIPTSKQVPAVLIMGESNRFNFLSK